MCIGFYFRVGSVCYEWILDKPKWGQRRLESRFQDWEFQSEYGWQPKWRYHAHKRVSWKYCVILRHESSCLEMSNIGRRGHLLETNLVELLITLYQQIHFSVLHNMEILWMTLILLTKISWNQLLFYDMSELDCKLIWRKITVQCEITGIYHIAITFLAKISWK